MICTGAREYPFTCLLVPSSEIGEYVEEHRHEIGELFTGNWEDEEHDALEAYADQNISGRNFERLYIRWTDALAIYSDNRHDSAAEFARLRAAALYEYCILVRRLLRNTSSNFSEIAQASTLAYFPLSAARARATRSLLSFADLEYRYIIAPRVKSIEAAALVERAMDNFGVRDLLKRLGANVSLAQQRINVIQAQWLAIGGVLGFIVSATLTILFKR
jgi:hypothetical protein